LKAPKPLATLFFSNENPEIDDKITERLIENKNI